MSDAAPPIQLPEHIQIQFTQNLAELRRRQPEVADLLERTGIPDFAVPAMGRDGSFTFRMTSNCGRTTWFGGSSMPSISAEAILAEVSATGGSVILPGMMTGQEALVLLQKLPTSAAVFIIEPDAGNLVIAMHLRDYAAALKSGRLVLLPMQLFPEVMKGLFKRFPGYVMPARMVTSPLLAHGEFELIQQRIGELAQTVFSIQEDVSARAREKVAARMSMGISARPRLAIVIPAGGDASLVSHALARAMRELDWPHVLIMQDHPGNMHVSALLSELASFEPELCLVINRTLGQVMGRGQIDVPAISWFLPGASLSREMPESSFGTSIYFASSPTQVSQLSDFGYPSERLAVCPVGLSSISETPIIATLKGPETRISTHVVIAPATDDQPQGSNVTLPSHVRLWNRLQELAQLEACDNKGSAAESLVRQAMHDIGMVGDDPHVVDFFTRAYRERLSPAALHRADEATLSRFAPSPAHFSPDEFCAWSRALRNDRMAEITIESIRVSGLRMVLIPCDFVQRSNCLLEAITLGMAVVIREADNDSNAKSSVFPDLAPLLFHYRSLDELTNAIQRAERVTVATRYETACRVRADHTITKRVEFMVSALRRIHNRSSDCA